MFLVISKYLFLVISKYLFLLDFYVHETLDIFLTLMEEHDPHVIALALLEMLPHDLSAKIYDDHKAEIDQDRDNEYKQWDSGVFFNAGMYEGRIGKIFIDNAIHNDLDKILALFWAQKPQTQSIMFTISSSIIHSS